MPSLEAYRRSLDYSYAPGLFPSMEALTRRPELVRRVLLHSKAEHSDATERLLAICQSHNIRVETADRALARLSGKALDLLYDRQVIQVLLLQRQPKPAGTYSKSPVFRETPSFEFF